MGREGVDSETVADQRRAAETTAGYGSIGWHAFRHKYETLLRGAKIPLDARRRLMRLVSLAF